MGQETIVRGEKLLRADPSPDELPLSAHARIDHDEVQRVGGKRQTGLADKPARPAHVVGWKIVGDVFGPELS